MCVYVHVRAYLRAGVRVYVRLCVPTCIRMRVRAPANATRRIYRRICAFVRKHVLDCSILSSTALPVSVFPVLGGVTIYKDNKTCIFEAKVPTVKYEVTMDSYFGESDLCNVISYSYCLTAVQQYY